MQAPVIKERGRGRPALNKVPKPPMVLLRPDSGQEGEMQQIEIADMQILRKSISIAAPKIKI